MSSSFFFRVFLAVLLVVGFVIACGGGGGDDVVDDDDFQGGVGVGADGVTIFWQYYTGNNFGLGSFALEDSSFIMAGNRGPDIDEQDVYLFKTDDQGLLEWEKPYPLENWEGAKVVRKTGDAGYVVAGTNRKASGDQDFLLIKTNSSGTQTWTSIFDNGFNQEGQSVWPRGDGGYLFLGNSWVENNGHLSWDACLYSIDAMGSWAGTVGCLGVIDVWERAQSMEKTADGGYIVAGAKGAGPADSYTWLVKTDSSGKSEWEKTYEAGTAYAVRSVEGGYIIAGKNAFHDEWTTADVLVIRTDSSGNQLWSKTFGGAGFDCANGIALAGTDAVVIAGRTNSFHTHTDGEAYLMLYLIKLDLDGNVLWQKVKGIADNSELADSIREVSDGGFIIAAGYGNILVKTDKNGDTVTLGSKDVSLTIPGVTGLIGFTNAVEAAGGGVQSIMLPWNIGYQGLEWILQVMEEGEGSICDSGSFDISPDPSGGVAEGDEYVLTFADCETAQGDTVIFSGSLTVAFNTLTGTFSSSTQYAVETEMTTAGFDAEDDIGRLTITGSLRFDRAVSPGGISETARSLPSETLSFSEEGVQTILSDFRLSASGDPISGLVVGGTGETVLYSHSSSALNAGMTLEVQDELVFGPGLEDPSGTFTVTAEDDSNLEVALDDGLVSLAVDTDGDGSTDGTIGTSWEELY